MLKIRIITIGKDKDSWVTAGCAHYLTLLKKHAEVRIVTVPVAKATPSLSAQEIRAREAELLKKHLGKGLTIALTDAGKKFDSHAFAQQLEGWHTTSGGQVSFLIGGPHGLDAELIERADASISLSPMTFSHQLVRLVLLEQLYRAFSIISGSPYHK